jgi:hypothetical protein
MILKGANVIDLWSVRNVLLLKALAILLSDGCIHISGNSDALNDGRAQREVLLHAHPHKD